jgi:hypothetical protein
MKRLGSLVAVVATAFATVAAVSASAATFTNTPLIATGTLPAGVTTAPTANSTGDSEPAIAFANDGTMAVDGLGWLPFQVNVWRGTFGSTPSYFGGLDQLVPTKGNGRLTLGDEDADIEFTSAGTMLLADLNVIINPAFNNAQLGVDVVRCPSGVAATGCTTTVLDQAGADRPWITHRGTTVWVSYHDAGNSSVVRVQRSTDDGQTWRQVSSPIVGQGADTGRSTFNNIQGPIVADPNSNYLYDIYASGERQTKCCSANFNNIFVSRSTDGGNHWTAQLVYSAPPLTALDNIFPSLAVDQTTGTVYATWTDAKAVWVSSSVDHGLTWAPAINVSAPAGLTTTLMPWVAARGNKADVVYYGSTAAQDDSTGVWNVFDSQLQSGSWTVSKVSNVPNRVGAVCTNGSACAGNTNRELLDLFEVAEDPLSNKAAIIFTNTEISTYTTPDSVVHKLPEIVLAFEQ